MSHLVQIRATGSGRIEIATPSPKGRIRAALCREGVTRDEVVERFRGFAPPANKPGAHRERVAAIRAHAEPLV